MTLNKVDLPHPDGPIMETNSPVATAKETSSTASMTPSPVVKRLLTRSTASSAGADDAAGVLVGWSRGVTCERLASWKTACSARSSLPRRRSRETRRALLPRKNLNQIRDLFLGQRRRRELERDRVLNDEVEPDDLVGIDRGLGKKVVARALRHRDGNSDELGVGFQWGGVVRVHPFDGFAVRLHVALERGLAGLQGLHVGDQDPDRLPLENSRVVAAGDDADLALVELLQSERRRGPADVDLSRHDLRQGRRRSTRRRGLGLEVVLLDERGDDPMRRRAVGGVRDRLAVRVLERLDR